RAAIRARQKCAVTYEALDGTASARTIRPLQLEYWGRVWTVTAWCEARAAFRVFRVDRIAELRPLPAMFTDEPGKTLDDYVALQAADGETAEPGTPSRE
ncbi:MAG: helix-turn-helix transcriptional regulator, partial [Shimia sp.]